MKTPKSPDSEINVSPINQLPFMCDEFCSLIENRSEEIQFRIDNLLSYLENEFFQRRRQSLEDRFDGLEHRVDEVWSLITGEEPEYDELSSRHSQIIETIWHYFDEATQRPVPVPDGHTCDEFYTYADGYESGSECEESEYDDYDECGERLW